jgi:hypothetical protein
MHLRNRGGRLLKRTMSASEEQGAVKWDRSPMILAAAAGGFSPKRWK